MATTLQLGPWKRNLLPVRDPARALPSAYVKPTTPPLRLLGSRGSRLTVPYAPLPVSHTGLATTWAIVDRPLRLPLELEDAPDRHVMSFELTLARRSWRASIEDWITALRKIGQSRELFTVAYGPLEAGLWRLAQLDLDVTARVPGSNHAARATAQLTLRAADTIAQLGPMTGGSGGARPIVSTAPSTAVSPAPVRGPAPAPKGKPAARSYVVRSGDTLSRISQAMYGSTVHWRAIADANRLVNANLIRPGQVLKIPAL